MKLLEKRILFIPINGVGHVNACIGIAKFLLKNKQRINENLRIGFFVDKTYNNKIKSLGFDEYLYYVNLFEINENDDHNEMKNPGEQAAKWLVENDILGKQYNILQQLQKLTKKPDDKYVEYRLKYIDELKYVIETFKPDIYFIDNIILEPIIHETKKPWIKIMSVTPLLYLYDIEHLPPAWSGLTTSDDDRKEWKKYRDIIKLLIFNKDFNDFNEQHGYKRYENDLIMPPTQSLTIYAYPEEYDYPEIKIHHPDWFNIEVFNKYDYNINDLDDELYSLEKYLPKNFYNDNLDGKFTGKYIYVSMGSMGSIDMVLMNKLINTLIKTNHKYIVSKGPKHNEYELKRNLWGERYLPQLKLLPLVDLVITHGGNNTVTETFAQGKPMIIMPLFCDQHDNAIRLSEKNFALRFDPYNYNDTDLINGIDQLLNDNELLQRLTNASKRIKNSNRYDILLDKIKNIIDNQQQQ